MTVQVDVSGAGDDETDGAQRMSVGHARRHGVAAVSPVEDTGVQVLVSPVEPATRRLQRPPAPPHRPTVTDDAVPPVGPETVAEEAEGREGADPARLRELGVPGRWRESKDVPGWNDRSDVGTDLVRGVVYLKRRSLGWDWVGVTWGRGTQERKET